MTSIVIMPGDGIGRVVVPEALRVLDAVGFRADYLEAEVGWSCWTRDGDALPARTIALLEEHHLGLFGAITSKKRDAAETELAHHLRGRGLEYVSPIVAIRQKLELDVCIRPSRSIPENPLNFVRRRGAAIEEPCVDVTVIFEATEDLFAGVEWTAPPEDVRRALLAHPRAARFAETPNEDLALACRIATRAACRRASEAAFAWAKRHAKTEVTLADKWGVMREPSAMFLAAAEEVARAHPEIAFTTIDADTVLAKLARQPERFQVILCGALIGDMISDAAAALTGGRGFAASASIGRTCAVFEPIHGSAPDLATLDPPRANPIATIEAAAMMLDHLGETERAARIRAAIARVVREKEIQTYDLLGGDRSAGATTRASTDAIIRALAPAAVPA